MRINEIETLTVNKKRLDMITVVKGDVIKGVVYMETSKKGLYEITAINYDTCQVSKSIMKGKRLGKVELYNRGEQLLRG
jgi:hypothetical protein